MNDHQAKWAAAAPLTGSCTGSQYLRKMFILPEQIPNQIRFIECDFGKPVFICQFVSADSQTKAWQIWDIETSSRRFLPGKIPKDGSFRLGPSAETMRVCVSIATGLALMVADDSLPCWATGNVGNMVRWTPPAKAKHIIIYSDASDSCADELAAYSLAYRLINEGKSCQVRICDSDTWFDHLTADFCHDLMTEFEDTAKRVFGDETKLEEMSNGQVH